MTQALVTYYGELQAGDKTYRFGAQQPSGHDITGDNVKDSKFGVAASPAAAVLLWSALTDLPASFKFLAIETDQEIVVEFVTDEGAEVGEELSTKTVSPGLPLVLGSDQSYANYSVNFAGGTLDQIETVRAKNLGDTDAQVRLLISD